MPTRHHRNPKRRLRASPNTQKERAELEKIADMVKYVGSPYHKRNPGDFGLTPPSCPRQNKSLCDVVEIYDQAIAQELLCDGVRAGLISEQGSNGFPRVIWAVSETTVLEARLDNQMSGTYHGYPLEIEDPFTRVVLERLERQ